MSVPYVDQGHHCGPCSWDTTPRSDFHAYTAVDQYPRHSSGHTNNVMNNCVRPGGHGHGGHHEPRKHYHGPPEARPRVCFVGCDESPIGGRRGKKLEKLVEESVDEEADDYIKARHKSFELSKWQTFNM